MLRKPVLTVLAAALVAAACDSPTSSGRDARLTVLLTDAPHEYLESAIVEIGRVEVLPADGPPVVVATDAGEFDLLQLQDGVTAVLGSVDVEVGRYLALRMVVRSASVTLKDGYTFNDGTTTMDLAVPSGAAAGIQVLLRSSNGNGSGQGAGIEIRPGAMTLVVDIDVSYNFVMLGTPDAGIQGFNFTPLLRAVIEDLSGSISGSVSAPDGVETTGLSVTATRAGAEPDEPPVTTLVKADGTFKLHFVEAGSYDITIAEPPAGHDVNPVTQVVAESEHVTGVELVISPQ
jgi:hypothetical protein